jgi:hypothetical protein
LELYYCLSYMPNTYFYEGKTQYNQSTHIYIYIYKDLRMSLTAIFFINCYNDLLVKEGKSLCLKLVACSSSKNQYQVVTVVKIMNITMHVVMN